MRPSRPSRGLPTSRAYWELKAEQMMNRVFSPEAAIDLDSPSGDGETGNSHLPGLHRPLPPATASGHQKPVSFTAGAASGTPPRKASTALTATLLAAFGGIGLVGALSAVLLVQQWAGLQRALSQERNLLLVERLRSMGPATQETTPPSPPTPPAPVLGASPTVAPASLAGGADLPPPPPEEPWMEQLPQLPPTGGAAPLLRVPVSPRLTAAAPPALPGSNAAPRLSGRTVGPQTPPPSSGPLPQLVGLVGAPGRAGSAIFQLGDTSTNVNVGEQIGSSGWKLSAADAESALIERGSDVRRIAILSGG